MREKPRGQRAETDDLWRGSRLVIALVVGLLAVMIFAVLRAGESSSRSGEEPDESSSALMATYDLAADLARAAAVTHLV